MSSSAGLASVLVFVSCFAMSWLIAKWVRCQIARVEKPSSLAVPLLPTQLVHRLDAAQRDAQDGYHKCARCGFENFKRFVFCTVCGGRLRQFDADFVVTSFETLIEMNKAVGGLYRRDAVSARQRRARQRKEWTRKLDVEGKLYWFRRSMCASATQTGTSRVAAHTSGFIARFKTPPEVLQEQLDAEATTQTKVERVKRLTAEVGATTLKFLASSRANPVVSTLSVTMSFRAPVEALLESSAKDFPTKYAMFVASTSQMLQISGKKTLRLYLYREDLFCQSMELLSEIPAHYIGALLRLSFVGESGIDAGALHREWVVLVSEALANRASGVFTCTNEGEQALSLNTNSAIDIGDDHLMYFHAAGRFIGRALLEGTALGFHLSIPLLKLILGLPLSFSDVEHYDPETYRSMQWLLDHEGVDALGLDFSLTVPHRDGSMVVVDLVPGGRDIAVTDANKHAFIERKWQYLLVESVSSQLYVFLKGLYEVLPHEHLMLFDPEELDFVLCGSNDIDVDDWEQSTKHADSIVGRPVRTWFWEIVREMPNEYRRRLLQFATGSDRVPLSGFSALTSHDGKLCPFTLNGVPLASGEYIWSHACFNQLDVPLYQSRAKLKAVLYAVLDTELHGFTTV